MKQQVQATGYDNTGKVVDVVYEYTDDLASVVRWMKSVNPSVVRVVLDIALPV